MEFNEFLDMFKHRPIEDMIFVVYKLNESLLKEEKAIEIINEEIKKIDDYRDAIDVMNKLNMQINNEIGLQNLFKECKNLINGL